MINKIKSLIILAAGSLMLMLGLFPAQSLAATGLDCAKPTSVVEAQQCGACQAAGIPDSECGKASSQSTSTLNNTVKNVINILSVVAGIIAVVMIVIAGFRYITGGGQEQAIA